METRGDVKVTLSCMVEVSVELNALLDLSLATEVYFFIALDLFVALRKSSSAFTS